MAEALPAAQAYAWVDEAVRVVLPRAAAAKGGTLYYGPGAKTFERFYVSDDVWALVMRGADVIPPRAIPLEQVPSAWGITRLKKRYDGDERFDVLAWGITPDGLEVACSNVNPSEMPYEQVGESVYAHEVAGHLWTKPYAAEEQDPIDRLVSSLFAFLAQPFISMASEPPPRAYVRAAERVGEDPPSDLKVITYRRMREGQAASGGGTAIEWSHRWLVRGHWRQQPIGPRNGPQMRVPRWISGYVKGPEDKPLIVAEKTLFAVVR